MLAKRGSTLFLKTVVILIGIAVLLLCTFVLPRGIMSDQTGDYRPILIGMYLPAIPFFLALYQILKLLNFVDQGKAFSESSIKALNYVKYCTALIGVMYAIGLPYIFYVADKDDAPGVVLIGLIFTFAPLVVSVFAAVCKKVLKNAIDLKSEHDLIV